MDTNVKRAARLAPEAARDTAVGTPKFTDIPALPQAAHAPLIGARSFSDILRGSTPRDLLVMADIHRRYLPDDPLPPALQRAIGRAWANGGTR